MVKNQTPPPFLTRILCRGGMLQVARAAPIDHDDAEPKPTGSQPEPSNKTLAERQDLSSQSSLQ